MKACGIVCEYNPFHNGHIHHIKETKKISKPDVLVCVMSGNFVQRGEPAIIDKWERAKCAVENGVDLVIELPFLYATQSATQFAKGSIDCLKLANIDTLVFGSESNNLPILQKLSMMDTSQFNELRQGGLSSAKAYEQIYGSMNANDILGISYLKELHGSTITPMCIQRTNNYHDETLQKISSATAIRKAIKENLDISETTVMKNLTKDFIMENYYPFIRMILSTTPPETLSTYLLMDEGIENNLIKNAKVANDYEAFIEACVSKRYTRSKIQRTLIHLMMQTTKEQADTIPPMDTLRVLAYNDTGKQYLKELKKQEVSIASRFNQVPEIYREMEIKAAHVYSYPLSVEKQNDWLKKELQSPIYVKL